MFNYNLVSQDRLYGFFCGQELPAFMRRGNLIITEPSQPQSFYTFAFAHLTLLFKATYNWGRMQLSHWG